MRKFALTSVILAHLLVAGAVKAQPQFFVDQPVNKASTLISSTSGEVILDWEFATMARNLLIKNGATNARGAIFLFEQCYSGGMLDDLLERMSTTVRWVGGSACRHDQVSWGQKNSAPFPLDYWVMGLDQALNLPELFFSDRMIEYINWARILDPVGPNGDGKEEPQSIYRNGGQNIRHKESIPQSNGGHNAILWAGKADGVRHINDIRVLYYRLVDEFQATGDPFSIIVLGNAADLGIPAMPATKANLQAAFDALEAIQGPNDDFLFFASNHGGCDTVVFEFNFPQVIGSGNNISQRFSLSLGEMEGIEQTPDCEPGLLFDFSLLAGRGLRVFVDGIRLPDDPFDKRDALGNPFLCIDRNVLQQIGPDIDVVLENQTGDRVLLNKVVFRTGAINNVLVDAQIPPAQVVNRQVLHGNWTGPGPVQWNALDHRVQLAVETGSPQTLGMDNLANTRAGINGIALDIKYLGGPLSASDFVFQMSPTGAFDEFANPPSGWQAAPLPSSVIVSSDGLQGSNRVLLSWPNQSIANRWLRITVKANSNTGLVDDTMFYVGHLLGEQTGHSDGTYTVAFADISPIRAAVGQSVVASSALDIDKNGTVSFADISAMRANVGAQLTNITIH